MATRKGEPRRRQGARPASPGRGKATGGGGPDREARGRSAEDEPEDREDLSAVEREAEAGGMHATTPGETATERAADLVEEAEALEGHGALGADARERAAEEAGGSEDLRIAGMTDAEMDARRRAAKDAARPTGTPE